MSDIRYIVISLIVFIVCYQQSVAQFRLIENEQGYKIYEYKNDSLLTGRPIPFGFYSSQDQADWQIIEQKFETKSVEELGIDASTISQTDFPPVIETVGSGTLRKKLWRQVHIHPARYDAATGQFVITRYLKIKINEPSRFEKNQSRLNQYPSKTSSNISHPLAAGVWYKLTYQKRGIYKITAKFLQDMGINLADIDPRKIQIWGTTGYMLPEKNSEPRPEFRQIPIMITGESDGSFDSNDIIYLFGNSVDEVDLDDIDSNNRPTFSHQLHYYSTQNSLFLTIANETGLRIETANEALTAGQSSETIDQFYDFKWKEDELFKTEGRLKSGRQWFGQFLTNETIGSRQVIYRDTLLNPDLTESIVLTVNLVGRAMSSTQVKLYVNETEVASTFISSISNLNGDSGPSARFKTLNTTFDANLLNKGILKLEAEVINSTTTSEVWIDYVRVTAKRDLKVKNNTLDFFIPKVDDTNPISTILISGFSEAPFVWDVSDPLHPFALNYTNQSDTYSIIYIANPATQLFATTGFHQFNSGIKIEPQNIHGNNTYPNYLIITTEKFKTYADDLANYRQVRDGLRPLVVLQEEVFNEFSGGVPDVVAIRDMVRYFYNIAGDDDDLMPKFLLFFGDTSYDFKNILGSSAMENHLFTYQTYESVHRINSYGSDDYFGLLDTNEGSWATTGELVDIGIGRLPVQTKSDAALILDKIKRYDSGGVTQGNWRTTFTFAGDDDFPEAEINRDLHILNADSTARVIDLESSGIRLKKIYLFDYPIENTSSGRRVPQATKDLITTINNGSLVFNYSGHGAEQILSDERFFVVDNIKELTNRDKLTIFVTATCSFGRFDDSDQQSGAELTMLHEEGGSIAAFTTVRVVYTGFSPVNNNFGLNIALTRNMTTRDENTGLPRYLGEIQRLTKNYGLVGPSLNSRKFVLLGDPATRIALPEKKINISQINNQTIDSDTILDLEALKELTLSGSIINQDFTTDLTFTGEVVFQVKDAARKVTIPYKEWMDDRGCTLPDCSYDIQNDILFTGRASVVNGEFDARFILPKDISFSSSSGRIELYAKNGINDANGSFNQFRISSINQSAVNDGKGPTIQIYMNDESFLDGGLVNETPKLIVLLDDPSGINAAATGVGHEMVATLENSVGSKETFVLNDYYSAELDDYTKGRAEFTLPLLKNDSYSVKVRAWDIFNNPTEVNLTFQVSESGDLKLRNVFNFPNPMNNSTKFVIEHNQPGNPLHVRIRIYTLSGKPIMQLEEPLLTTLSPYIMIDWDGRDRDGDRLATGTYLYHVKVSAETVNGKQIEEKIEKLVIIR